MGKKWFSRLVLLVTAVCILLPAALLLPPAGAKAAAEAKALRP